jgi:hypothetical protein
MAKTFPKTQADSDIWFTRQLRMLNIWLGLKGVIHWEK